MVNLPDSSRTESCKVEGNKHCCYLLHYVDIDTRLQFDRMHVAMLRKAFQIGMLGRADGVRWQLLQNAVEALPDSQLRVEHVVLLDVGLTVP